MFGRFYRVNMSYNFRTCEEKRDKNETIEAAATDNTFNLLKDLGYRGAKIDEIKEHVTNESRSFEYNFRKYLNKRIYDHDLFYDIIIKGCEHVELDSKARIALTQKFENSELIVKDLFDYVEFHCRTGEILVPKVQCWYVHILFNKP